MDTKTQIETLEARLIEAMKTSNVAELDVLLADNLVFTNQNGHLVSKEDDLNAHRSGEMEIYTLETSAQIIEVLDDATAVVSVIKDMSLNYSGHTTIGIYRFTRVWHNNGANWQIVAVHSSQVI
jgi:hypothetical protein